LSEAAALKFKHELVTLGIAFVVSAIIFQIVFYNESPLTVLRLTGGLFWLFTIPGMAILLQWKERVSAPAMVVMGTILGMAVVGIGSYYLGLIGLNIKYSAVILPIIFVALAITAELAKKKPASS
jgi:hypothetical protein